MFSLYSSLFCTCLLLRNAEIQKCHKNIPGTGCLQNIWYFEDYELWKAHPTEKYLDCSKERAKVKILALLACKYYIIQ
jgi:hypothetical protein